MCKNSQNMSLSTITKDNYEVKTCVAIFPVEGRFHLRGVQGVPCTPRFCVHCGVDLGVEPFGLDRFGWPLHVDKFWDPQSGIHKFQGHFM